MKHKFFLLSALALLTALLITSTGFAEGEAPNVPAVEVPQVPAAEVPTAQPTDPAAVVVEAPVIEPTSAPEIVATPSTEPIAEEPVVAEVPSVITVTPIAPEAAASVEPSAPAEETKASEIQASQVVVVDSAGEPMDMASQASAAVLDSADPYFKVGTITYRFSDAIDYCVAPFDLAHCFDGDTSYAVDDPIQDTIDYIRDYPVFPTDGKIYVEKATYTHSVSIDADTYVKLNALKGLIGVTIPGGLFPADYPTINGNVTISGTHLGFTLSGFTISGYVSFTDNTGALVLQDLDVANLTADGINVNNQNGSITVKNVKSHDNHGNGAHLNNTTSGNVTVSESIFNDNYYTGLYIQTHGTTTANNVIANGNRYRGMLLNGFTGVSLKNFIANNNIQNEGIYITNQSGAMTLENITANGNGGNGFEALLNTQVNVTIKNLAANDNSLNGLLLKTLGAVTITNSQTNNNIYNNGLSIETSGKVTLNSIHSSGNNESGLIIKGIELTDPSAPGITGMASPALVTISSPANAAQSNVFDGNGQYGIHIITDKLVSISNFSASGNLGDHGVLLKGFDYYKLNPDGTTYTLTTKFVGATTISTTVPNFYNKANNNGDSGFQVDSSGTVKIDRTLANGNGYRGFEVNSTGSITVSNLKANGNAAEAVKLFNKDAATAMPVTVTNLEATDNTGEKGRGLDIESRGIVKVTTLKSLNNSELGLNINNKAGGLGTGSITLTTLTLNNNGSAGMEVFSNALISLKGVTANDNGGTGISAENGDDFVTAGINLTSVHADGNNGAGISVFTNGNLVVKDASASSNAKTDGIIKFGDISAGEFNVVQDYINASYGVDAWYFTANSSSSTTVRMEAGGTYPDGSSIPADGLYPDFGLYDDSDTLISTTPLTCGIDAGHDYCEFTFSATASETYHVLASSTGTDGFYRISVNNPAPFTGEADLYWDFGVDISTNGSAAFSGTNTFNNNSMTGLKMWLGANGARNISASNVTADGNGFYGMTLYNYMGSGSVTLSGNNETLNNGWGGLYVDTSGTVVASNVDASFNGQTNDDNGVYINGRGTGKAVTLTHITTLDNSIKGIYVVAKGNVTLSNLRANNNNKGVYILNQGGTGNVLLAGFNEASHNTIGGFETITNGTVTLSNLEAAANGATGVKIQSNGINKAVTLNFVTAMDNGGTGISATTNGLTTLNTVRSWLNANGAMISSNTYSVVAKYSSFMGNDTYGLEYKKYLTPFTFTNTSNIFLGNGTKDLYVN